MTVGAIRSLALVALVSIFVSSAIAQDATSGKNFWVAFPQNARFEIGAARHLVVVTALQDADVSITRPAGENSFSLGRKLAKGETYKFDLDTNLACIRSEVVEDKGVHIGSTGDIVVTAYTLRKASTDSYRVMPLSALEKEYMVVGYQAPTADPRFTTEFVIVATEDNTNIDIELTGLSKSSTQYNHRFSITLMRGETYDVKGVNKIRHSGDLTGSLIVANKPIAVFTGHTCAQVPSDRNFCDVLVEQAAPLSRAGREFIVPRMQLKQAYALRIVATKPSTNITAVSQHFTLNAGQHLDFDYVQGDQIITSTHPVIVAQYATGFDADSSHVGDPFMTLIAPTSVVCNEANIYVGREGHFYNYLAIVTDRSSLDSLLWNGLKPEHSSIPHSEIGEHVIVHLEVLDGFHRLTGRNIAVYSYGFGVGGDNFDSYGTYCGPW